MARPFSPVQLARLGADFRATDVKIGDADLAEPYAKPADLAAYAPADDLAGLNAQVAALYPLVQSAVQPGDLGTAATADSADFATAAQGAKADSALQPSAPPLTAYTVTFTGTLNAVSGTVTLAFDANGRLTSAGVA